MITVSRPSGKGDVDALQIVLRRAAQAQAPSRCPCLRVRGGPRCCRRPDRNCPVSERSERRISGIGAGEDHLPAVAPGPGAQVHDVVRGAQGLLVVLHHDEGVAQVAQSAAACSRGAGCRAGAARWWARPGCTARRPGRSRSGWPGGCAAPRRPTGWRRGAPGSGTPGRRWPGSSRRGRISLRIWAAMAAWVGAKSQRRRRRSRPARTEMLERAWMSRPATVTARLSGFRRRPPQAGHSRWRMKPSSHCFTPSEVVSRYLRRRSFRMPRNGEVYSKRPVCSRFTYLTWMASLEPRQQDPVGLLRKLGQRRVQGEAEAAGHGLQDAAVPVGLGVVGEDGALVDGQGAVGDDQLGVELQGDAQSGALGAGAEGAVEREQPGLQLRHADAAVRAGAGLRETAPPARSCRPGTAPPALRRPPPGRSRWSRPGAWPPRGPAPAGPRRSPGCACAFSPGVMGSSSVRSSPSTRSRTKPARRASSMTFWCSPLRPRTTGASSHSREPAGMAHHGVDDLVHGLFLDLAPAARAVRDPDAGVQQAQVVVDLGHGAHGGAGVGVGALLLDGDGRGQAVDVVDVGLVQAAQELAGVGGQGLHVAPLPLGEYRVEGQRGLAGAADPADHDEPVARQLQVDVLEIVLPGPPDDDLIHWTQVARLPTRRPAPPAARTGGGACRADFTAAR